MLPSLSDASAQKNAATVVRAAESRLKRKREKKRAAGKIMNEGSSMRVSVRNENDDDAEITQR